jgi:CDGSH-type Zn-finger protein/uncharacterized Fe-S cluster protein YjdI
MATRRSYTGKDIEIGFEMARCIHARNCFLKLPQVFDPTRRPWIDPEAAPVEYIAAMIRTCPSGALTFARTDGGRGEAPPGVNRIAVLENGPLALAGDLVVDGEEMTRATLCRCGKSSRKPFCDYGHVGDGFAATGEPKPVTPAGESHARGGRVTVTPQENASLRVEGAVEITTGTGRRIAIREKAFLCRCGQSKNKPFCDGSHRDAGFEAPGPTGD